MELGVYMSEDQLLIDIKSPIHRGQCPDCRHYIIGKINFSGPDTPRSCAKGNTGTLVKFFSDCGTLTRDQAKDYLVQCFEPTEHSMMLQELLNISGDILEQLKKNDTGGA